jgi:hypothetical protein
MSAALGHSAISGGRRSHRPRSVRARDAAAHVTLALALLALAVGAAACGGQALTEPEPVVSGPEAAADALRRVQLERRVAALREGWRTAWSDGYWRGLEDAKREWPAAFQREVGGDALRWGGGALVLGLLLGLTALGAPRRSPRPPLTRPAARAMDAAGRAVGRLGRGVGALARGVASEDPRDAAERVARDTARHLEALAGSLERAGATLEPAGVAELTEAIASWRGELAEVCRDARRLSALGADRHVEGLVALLVPGAALAERLRVEAQRAESGALGLRSPLVAAWRKALSAREPVPVAEAPPETPTWATPAARLGAAALVLALFGVAAWATAGALPAFLALPALAAALAVRLAGRLGARPGPRPTTARREPRTRGLDDSRLLAALTALGAVTFVAAALSSSASVRSGLDLGSPPPLGSTIPEAAPGPPDALLAALLERASQPEPAAPRAPDSPATPEAP